MFLIKLWQVLVFLIAFWSPKQSKNEGELCIIHGKENGSSFTSRIQALELRSPLPKPIKNAMRKNRERNLTRRNSRGEQLKDTFRVLPGVHFIHTIYRFESWEVKSPTLQTVCKSELKWRSYSHWKTTAPSWKTISQVAKSTCEIKVQLAKWTISTCEMDNFNLRNFWKSYFNLQNPPM